jgi:hypothetical protein
MPLCRNPILGKIKKKYLVLGLDHDRVWLAQCLFDSESRRKNERQAFLLKLSYGAVKDLIPTAENKETLNLYEKVVVFLTKLRDMLCVRGRF